MREPVSIEIHLTNIVLLYFFYLLNYLQSFAKNENRKEIGGKINHT